MKSSFISPFFLSLLIPISLSKPHPRPPPPLPTWTLTPTNTTFQYRGLSPLNAQTIFVSGTNATVLLSTTSGRTWTNISPQLPPSDPPSALELRDIHALTPTTAVTLSIGAGNLSRIYRTTDSGASWSRVWTNTEPDAFYDCLDFDARGHGLALSDPVNGTFRLLASRDAGRSWHILQPETMPLALPGEFAFAASGTCISSVGGAWYFATGGVDPGRVFRSADQGHTWSVADSRIAGGEAAGVFSVRFAGGGRGVAVGGDYLVPGGKGRNAAWSVDGGETWTGVEEGKGPGGYRSGVAWAGEHVAVAVGTSGSDVTLDGGRTWRALGNDSFDAVECVRGEGGGYGSKRKNICWASGARGRVGWLDVSELV